MKNPHIESLIRQAKLTHRHDRRFYLSTDGIRARHAYDDHRGLTFWDDVQFVLNDYRVSVHFMHPRYVYETQADDLARDAVRHLRPPDQWPVLVGSPNFRRNAPTRRLAKKVISYTMPPTSEQRRAYFAAWTDARSMQLRSCEISVVPTWTSGWRSWCRYVNITAPLEVSQEMDLVPLVQLARRLLLQQTTLETEFPAYRYGREQWLQENPGPDATPELHSHAVA